MRIHRCAQRGDRAGVERELLQGASIHAIDREADPFSPQTPLQYAIASPVARIDLVEFLLDQGAIVSLTSQDGKSDLHWAVQSGKPEKVQFMLDVDH